jgi:hypothetical protein
MDLKKRIGDLFFKDVDDQSQAGTAHAPEAVQEPASQGGGMTVTLTPPTTNGDGPRLELTQGPPSVPVREDGTLDFAAIYQLANVSQKTYTAQDVLDVLGLLGDDKLADDAKRRWVMRDLTRNKNNGASVEGVTADAQEKLEALTTFSKDLAEATSMYVAELEGEVAELNEQIKVRCQEIEQAKGQLTQATNQCGAESKRLEGVVVLLGLDSAPPK